MKKMSYQEKLDVQKPIIEMIMKALPDSKKKSLYNATNRNCILTSEYLLRNGTITTYKEGWYLELEGCRSRFAVWAWDCDGVVEIGRKPIDSKINKIWGLAFDNTSLDAYPVGNGFEVISELK